MAIVAKPVNKKTSVLSHLGVSTGGDVGDDSKLYELLKASRFEQRCDGLMDMMMQYLRVVHNIQLDASTDCLDERIKHYVSNLDDPILTDTWNKHLNHLDKELNLLPLSKKKVAEQDELKHLIEMEQRKLPCNKIMEMMVEYMRVVHDIQLDTTHGDWKKHLKYYVARLNDPILSDTWSKHVRHVEVALCAKRRIQRNLKLKKKPDYFFLLDSAPKLIDFINRYRYQRVSLSWI